MEVFTWSKKYFYKFPKRILVSPIPSLCSHIDLNGLAPIVDWGELSTFIREKNILLINKIFHSN